MIRKNVGGIDRIARVTVGIALLTAFFIGPETAYNWLLLLGVVPLVTGLLRNCPIYTIIGVTTCPAK